MTGADIYVDADVPIGGGISSSASFELAVALALLAVNEQELAPRQIAAACQRGEYGTVGVRCGIMDQYAIADCRESHAMLIDCRTLDVDYIRIPDSMSFVVVHSGVEHCLPVGEFNDRRGECEDALKIVRRKFPNLSTLCDLPIAELEKLASDLGPFLVRRVRHVITENQRVAEAVAALRSMDIVKLGKLLTASHQSLRNDYCVSCDASDDLVATLSKIHGVFGARQIGAGFGGCVIALVANEYADRVAEQIHEQWSEEIGDDAWVHVSAPTGPAKEVALST